MGVIEGLLLAAPAGLKAYLTLLLAGLAGRLHGVDLGGYWGRLLTEPLSLVVLLALAIYEVVADKFPGLDSVNNVIGTFIRPVAGGLLMVADRNPLSESGWVLAFLAGFATAGGLHLLKTALRSLVTVGTFGLATPFVSTIEDVFVVAMVLLATAPAIAAS